MLGAGPLNGAPEVTLPLDVKGWYSITVGYWNPTWAYKQGMSIRLKLSGDPCFTPMTDPGSGTGYTGTTLFEDILETRRPDGPGPGDRAEFDAAKGVPRVPQARSPQWPAGGGDKERPRQERHPASGSPPTTGPSTEKMQQPEKTLSRWWNVTGIPMWAG